MHYNFNEILENIVSLFKVTFLILLVICTISAMIMLVSNTFIGLL